MSPEEFENLFWLFAVAGTETLRNGLPGAMVALLAHPEGQQRLRAHPPLLATAVDELLRWWAPVMTFRRTATAEATLAGVQVRARTKVVVSSTSANRDDRSSQPSGHAGRPRGSCPRRRAAASPLHRYREKMPSWLLVRASPEERNRANCPRRAPRRALSPAG